MLPEWLLWLLPVPLATLGAVVWASWAARPSGPRDTADTVAQYQRFRAALGESVERSHDRPQGGHSSADGSGAGRRSG